MSRSLFAFLLSELKTVRLVCQKPHCGGVTELSVEKVAQRFGQVNAHDSPCCPVCNTPFDGVGLGPQNQIAVFARSVLNLAAVTGSLQIEFILPDNEKA